MKIAMMLVPITNRWSKESHNVGDFVVVAPGDQAKKDEYSVTYLTKPIFTTIIKRTDVKFLTKEEKKLVRLLLL